MSNLPKLTAAQIAEIRAWHAARTAIPKPREIRERFGIPSSRLSAICRGIAYKKRA